MVLLLNCEPKVQPMSLSYRNNKCEAESNENISPGASTKFDPIHIDSGGALRRRANYERI